MCVYTNTYVNTYIYTHIYIYEDSIMKPAKHNLKKGEENGGGGLKDYNNVIGG
jgi:hypothetical protein